MYIININKNSTVDTVKCYLVNLQLHVLDVLFFITLTVLLVFINRHLLFHFPILYTKRPIIYM